MATRKNASKVSSKASLNINLDEKATNKSLKSAGKEVKKMGAGSIILVIVLLIVGIAGGVLVSYFLTRNDCFEIIGQEELTLTLDETYTDEGVNVISFNKDVSDKVKIDTNLTKNPDGTYSADEVGTYYIIYTVDDFKYGTIFNVQKIRLITFVETSEGGEWWQVQRKNLNLKFF